MRKALKISALLVLLVFVAPVIVHAVMWLSEERPGSWRDADWSSAGTLPDPRAEPEASIRVMAARTGGLKGIVSVHTWLVLKPAGADAYDRYDVVGWGDPVRRNSQPADGRWYSNVPVVIYELKGDEAARLLPKVEAAIRAYQWSERGSYRIWPGPNSNTFVARVLAAVPELNADMPPTAIGRDYPAGGWVGRAPAGGLSLSLGGVAGVTLGVREGIEVNLLGLVAGVRLDDPALILPGFGALGEPF
jgi:Protein of unknown function (DUF3750)